MINKKFGRLTVLKELERENGNRVYLCQCECGNEKAVRAYNLKNGRTKSCGCLRKEVASGQVKHGASGEWWYGRWITMIQRCHNPKANAYENYGATGVYVCDEWKNDPWSYGQWLLDQMEELGLDEKSVKNYDVDKDLLGKGYYGPDACVLMKSKENSAMSGVNHNKKGSTGRQGIKITNSLTGEELYFKNKKEAAKHFGLSQNYFGRLEAYNEWLIEKSDRLSITEAELEAQKQKRKTVLTNAETGERHEFQNASKAAEFLGISRQRFFQIKNKGSYSNFTWEVA